jgi:hypothetical protein
VLFCIFNHVGASNNPPFGFCSSSEAGLDLQRAIDVMPQCLADQPHFSKAFINYCSALLAYNARAAQVDRAWVRRLSWGWYIFLHLVRIVDSTAKGLDALHRARIIK